MKTLKTLIGCFLIMSCNSPQLETEFKDQNGLFTCKITSQKLADETCSGQIEFKTPTQFSIAAFGTQTGDLSSLQNTIYLFNSNHSCSETVSFFPVGLIELTNQQSIKKIIVGIPVEPTYNKHEITDFFHFQIAFSNQIKATTDWIEKNLEGPWLVSKWQDEKSARTHLERIIRGF